MELSMTVPVSHSLSESRVRVRYAETDQMGVVYHSHYFIWFEVGRVDLCRHLGFEYKQMEADEDTMLVVAEGYCRFKRPARFDDVDRVHPIETFQLTQHTRGMAPDVWRNFHVVWWRPLIFILDQAMHPHAIFEIDRVDVGSCGRTRQHVNVVPTGGEPLRQIVR